MSKRKKEFEKEETSVEFLKKLSTEKLLELRNNHISHKKNKYWRKGCKRYFER
jgi:hypothetical protein